MVATVTPSEIFAAQERKKRLRVYSPAEALQRDELLAEQDQALVDLQRADIRASAARTADEVKQIVASPGQTLKTIFRSVRRGQYDAADQLLNLGRLGSSVVSRALSKRLGQAANRYLTAAEQELRMRQEEQFPLSETVQKDIAAGRWTPRRLIEQATSTGTAAIPTVVGAMALGPAAGAVIGAAQTAGPSYAQSVERGLSRGLSPDEAEKQGIASGLSSGLVTLLTQKLPLEIMTKAGPAVSSTIRQAVAKAGGRLAAGGLAEGVQEAIEGSADDVWQSLYETDPEAMRGFMKRRVDEFILGFTTGGIFTGPAAVRQAASDVIVGLFETPQGRSSLRDFASKKQPSRKDLAGLGVDTKPFGSTARRGIAKAINSTLELLIPNKNEAKALAEEAARSAANDRIDASLQPSEKLAEQLDTVRQIEDSKNLQLEPLRENVPAVIQPPRSGLPSVISSKPGLPSVIVSKPGPPALITSRPGVPAVYVPPVKPEIATSLVSPPQQLQLIAPQEMAAAQAAAPTMSSAPPALQEPVSVQEPAPALPPTEPKVSIEEAAPATVADPVSAQAEQEMRPLSPELQAALDRIRKNTPAPGPPLDVTTGVRPADQVAVPSSVRTPRKKIKRVEISDDPVAIEGLQNAFNNPSKTGVRINDTVSGDWANIVALNAKNKQRAVFPGQTGVLIQGMSGRAGQTPDMPNMLSKLVSAAEATGKKLFIENQFESDSDRIAMDSALQNSGFQLWRGNPRQYVYIPKTVSPAKALSESLRPRRQAALPPSVTGESGTFSLGGIIDTIITGRGGPRTAGGPPLWQAGAQAARRWIGSLAKPHGRMPEEAVQAMSKRKADMGVEAAKANYNYQELESQLRKHLGLSWYQATPEGAHESAWRWITGVEAAPPELQTAVNGIRNHVDTLTQSAIRVVKERMGFDPNSTLESIIQSKYQQWANADARIEALSEARKKYKKRIPENILQSIKKIVAKDPTKFSVNKKRLSTLEILRKKWYTKDPTLLKKYKTLDEAIKDKQTAWANADARRRERYKAWKKYGYDIPESVIKATQNISASDPTKFRASQSRLDAIDNLKKKWSIIDTMEANIGSYMTRSYEAFTNRSWWNQVPTETIDNFRRVVKQHIPEATDVEVDHLINEILQKARGSSNPIVAFGGIIGNPKANILKKRMLDYDPSKPVFTSPEFRTLLGERQNLSAYGDTVTKITSFITQHEALKTLHDLGLASGIFQKKGQVTDPQKAVPLVGLDPRSMANEGSVEFFKNPLSNLETTPEIRDALAEGMRSHQQVSGWLWNGLFAYEKLARLAVTVGSPKSQSRNFISNALIAVQNGTIPTREKLSLAAHAAAHGGTNGKAYRNNTEAVRLWRDLVKHQIVNDSVDVGTLQFMQIGRGEPILKRIGKYATGGIAEVFGENVAHVASTLAKAGIRGPMELYQAGDNIWKAMQFEELSAIFSKALPALGSDGAKQMAAEWVANENPSYSRIPQFMRTPVGSPIGLFFAFRAERIRNTLNWWKNNRWLAQQAMAGNTELGQLLGKRLAGYSLKMGVVKGLPMASQMVLGISDDEDRAVRDLTKTWDKYGNLSYETKVKDGVVTYTNNSWIDPDSWQLETYNALREEGTSRAAQMLASPWLSPSLSVQALRKLYDRWNKFDPAATKREKAIKYLGTPIMPAAGRQLRDLYRGIIGYQEEGKMYTPETALRSLFGSSITRFNASSALVDNATGYKSSLPLVSRAFNQQVKNNADILTPQQLADHYMAMEETRNGLFKSIVKNVESARVLGVSEEQIKDSLLKGGLQGEEIRNVMAPNGGEYQAYTSMPLRIAQRILPYLPGSPQDEQKTDGVAREWKFEFADTPYARLNDSIFSSIGSLAERAAYSGKDAKIIENANSARKELQAANVPYSMIEEALKTRWMQQDNRILLSKHPDRTERQFAKMSASRWKDLRTLKQWFPQATMP